MEPIGTNVWPFGDSMTFMLKPDDFDWWVV